MLMELIDRFLVEEAVKDVYKRDPNRVRPTEASVKIDGIVYGSCLRSSWYSLKHFKPRPPDARALRVMEVGKALEQLEAERCRRMGILVEKPLDFKVPNPLEPNQIISGRKDFYVHVDGHDYVVEYKTGSGYPFEKNVIKGGKSTIDHVLQISLYLHFGDIKRGLLVYLDRGYSHYKEFLIYVDNDGHIYQNNKGIGIKVDDILMRYKELYQYVTKGILPPRDYIPFYTYDMATAVKEGLQHGRISKSMVTKWEKGKAPLMDWHCRYCPFIQYCIFDVKNQEEADEKITGYNIDNFIFEYYRSFLSQRKR